MLPEICIADMTVRDRSIDLRLWREEGEVRIAVTRGDRIRIVHRPFALHANVGVPPA